MAKSMAAKSGERSQRLVDQADALEELRPVDVRHQPHAGDDVAHRDVRGALALVFFLHQLLGAGLLFVELLLEPHQRRRDLRILIAQPMHELHGERRAASAGDLRSPARSASGSTCWPFTPSRRSASASASCRASAAGDDALRDAPQVLDQHDAQRDGHRPELADRERLDALVGAHETPQGLGFEAAVGVRDECPGDAEHARKAGERSGGELGQLAVEAAAADPRGSRGSALRRRGSCRAPTRRRA